MKCPKCGYIGFEAADRCRNCGYEFVLAQAEPESDLPLAAEELVGRPVDLDEFVRPAAGGPPPPRREGRAGAHPSGDLPLFGPETAGDDRPLVVPSPTPRPPLAVRRSTPAAMRSHSRVPLADRPRLQYRPDRAPERDTPLPRTQLASVASAGAVRQLVSTAIDAALILGIDLVVVYFTLRVCRLALLDVLVLPAAPMAFFLAVLDGGYLLAFTAAGGQTLGKMAVGTHVVDAGGLPVTVGQAVLRSLASMPSALLLGLGYVPLFMTPARRTLHDRLAGTCVVPVPAAATPGA